MYHQIEHRLEQNAALRVPMHIWQRRARREIAEQATRIVGCSRSVLSRVYPAADEARFGVLHPSLDVRGYDFGLGEQRADARRKARQALGLPEDGLLVVNVGNVNYAKNQRIILDIAERTTAGGVEATFAIIGHGPLSHALSKEITERRLATRVHLLGARDDVAAWLCAADLALHPSVAEGLPVSVLEYQAAGLPVIGSNAAPVLEALSPENRSFAADPQDASALAASIARLAADAVSRDAVAAASRRWVEKWFSMERNFADLAELYA
jgi:glycosyltransferase involved in cell wall biosynthesis